MHATLGAERLQRAYEIVGARTAAAGAPTTDDLFAGAPSPTIADAPGAYFAGTDLTPADVHDFALTITKIALMSLVNNHGHAVPIAELVEKLGMTVYVDALVTGIEYGRQLEREEHSCST